MNVLGEFSNVVSLRLPLKPTLTAGALRVFACF